MKSLKRFSGLMAALAVLAIAAHAVPPGTDDEIRERLTPFGELCQVGEDCGQAAAASSGGGMSGQQVYDQFCFACHATGVGNAPVRGEVADWEPRLAKGMDTLWDHTLNGFNAMPPKGTCMNCSEDELREALDYLLADAE